MSSQGWCFLGRGHRWDLEGESMWQLWFQDPATLEQLDLGVAIVPMLTSGLWLQVQQAGKARHATGMCRASCAVPDWHRPPARLQ